MDKVLMYILAICNPACDNGKCTSPGKCTCNEGWEGPTCNQGEEK